MKKIRTLCTLCMLGGDFREKIAQIHYKIYPPNGDKIKVVATVQPCNHPITILITEENLERKEFRDEPQGLY